MRIDLNTDRGILPQTLFQIHDPAPLEEKQADPVASDEEDHIIETLSKRHAQVTAAAHVDEHTDSDAPEATKPAASKPRTSSRRGLYQSLLIIIILAVLGYYLYNRGDLQNAWNWTLERFQAVSDDSATSPEDDGSEKALRPIVVLSDEQFNLLMPMTPELRAIQDSINATIAANQGDMAESHTETISGDLTPEPEVERDTVVLSETISLVDHSDDVNVGDERPTLDLSGLDLEILQNHSLLLMLSRVGNALGDGTAVQSIELDRQSLRIKGSGLDRRSDQVLQAIDEFTMAKLSASNDQNIAGGFEIIIPPVYEFSVDVRDALGILDVIAHPFEDQLNQIIFDLNSGVDNNPMRLEFSGSMNMLVNVLEKWSDVTLNYILEDASLVRSGNRYQLTINIRLIPYSA